MAIPPKMMRLPGGELVGVEYYWPGVLLTVDGIVYRANGNGSGATQVMQPMMCFKSEDEYTNPYRWAPGVPHLAERGLLRG